MWPGIRLVVGRYASLQELETHWSIDDILDFTDALDVLDEKAPKPKG